MRRVPSLRELQESFANALRDPAAACAVAPSANLDIYRNNSRSVFRSALEQIYPVVRRRVGDDYFRQLAFHYRAAFPSRSGDLHWAGRDFPGFLAAHLRGGDYEWLADLARLEWARCEASVAPERPAVGVESLAGFAPSELEHLVFVMQPSMRLISSPYPVFAVWQANQFENASPVDQSLGPEYGLVRNRDDMIEVETLAPDFYSFLAAVSSGATLGGAMSATDIDGERLTEILAVVFESSLVCAVKADMPGRDGSGHD
jgi:hypothetical protein